MATQTRTPSRYLNVYLPAPFPEMLEKLVEKTGRSKASLIKEAIKWLYDYYVEGRKPAPCKSS